MTARQFPTTLMRDAMWSEQLCICEFFKTWTPVGFHEHVILTLRRYIWRLVRLGKSILQPKCSPDNSLEHWFLLEPFWPIFRWVLVSLMEPGHDPKSQVMQRQWDTLYWFSLLTSGQTALHAVSWASSLSLFLIAWREGICDKEGRREGRGDLSRKLRKGKPFNLFTEVPKFGNYFNWG